MNKDRSRRFLRRLLFFYVLLVLVYWCRRTDGAPLRPPHTDAYIREFEAVAREVSEHTGVPEAIILAVGGLESSWGGSELARRGNNHFGIKVKRRGQARCCLPTREYYRRKAQTVKACFRAYDQAYESFYDFGALLSSEERYASLFHHRRKDYRRWAEGLESCGYATDPNYAEKLIRIIRQYGLDR